MGAQYRPPDEGAEKTTDPAGATRPWERLPREGDQAWAYFQLYLQQGYPNGPGGDFHPRNVSELARTIGVTRDYLAHVSSDFHWPQRAGAWDREVERRKSEADLTEVARSRSRWLRIVSKARTLGEAELDKYLSRSTGDPTVPVLTAKDAMAVMDWARNVERQYLQEAKVKDVQDDQDVDLENLELEDLEALHSVLQKAKGQAG